jgi:hypothetical protein
MISLPTPTKPLTSQSLTPQKREALVELLAQRWLDQMDLRDLEVFFLNTQAEYLNDYTDAELIAEVEDNTSDEEFEELINEIAG